MSSLFSSSQAASTSLPSWRQANANPFIQIEQLSKQFGDFTAVNSVSLDIYKKELICLLC